MHYQSNAPKTAMEIRDKIRLVEQLADGDVDVFLRGTWTPWVNGDEYNEVEFIVSTPTPLTNIGTRYVSFSIDGKDIEVKPELADPESFEIRIVPRDLSKRLEGLPPNLIDTYCGVSSLEGSGNTATFKLLAEKLDKTPQIVSFLVEQLESIGLVRTFKSGGLKAVTIQ